jgi:ubiquinone/menaquinone biosynthesis C-methylase UbiE
VIGHGMNAVELAENPRFTRWFTHDLNADPRLPLEDAVLDAATLCVSIQYLTRPVDALADIRRCLKPGAPLVISFSNRCFPTKAVRLWMALRSEDHARLVEAYLAEAGFKSLKTHRLVPAWPTDPMTAVIGRA